MVFINHSSTFLPQCHFNVNNNLYYRFEQAYSGELTVAKFNPMLDTICKNIMVNYVQDYIKNEKHGSDVNAFYNAYKYYHSLTYFLPGIPWVLNGQENPQFESLNLFSNKPFSRKFMYNSDFYRSLNLLRKFNPALWNSDISNLPVKVSNSNEVLALERKSGNYSCVGMFNLTNHSVGYFLNTDYKSYYDAFNKVQVNFTKDMEINLGPYQSIIITNSR